MLALFPHSSDPEGACLLEQTEGTEGHLQEQTEGTEGHLLEQTEGTEGHLLEQTEGTEGHLLEPTEGTEGPGADRGDGRAPPGAGGWADGSSQRHRGTMCGRKKQEQEKSLSKTHYVFSPHAN